MNKLVVILIFMITLNLTFTWFNLMGFSPNNAPEGQNIENQFDETMKPKWIINGFLLAGLAIIGALVSSFLKVSAFGIIIFTILFWLPYANTVSIFNAILIDTPAVFSVGLLGMFTTIMALLYIYTMIEWSRDAGV